MTNAPKRSRLLSFSPASERPTRTAGDDRVIAGADHAEHDDFGGLHRDLIATGAAIDRRELFRIAARLGVGVSALSILGCSGNTETSPTSSSSIGGGRNSACSKVPEETAGPYPGDSSNGPMVRYSLYSSGATNQNYLRGVQEADAGGKVTFTSIYPGCYAGRRPHIHFEVYPSLASSTSAANKSATSQIATAPHSSLRRSPAAWRRVSPQR